jgi:hypothetical protein
MTTRTPACVKVMPTIKNHVLNRLNKIERQIAAWSRGLDTVPEFPQIARARKELSKENVVIEETKDALNALSQAWLDQCSHRLQEEGLRKHPKFTRMMAAISSNHRRGKSADAIRAARAIEDAITKFKNHKKFESKGKYFRKPPASMRALRRRMQKQLTYVEAAA